jgi:hypothetical protein
MAEAICDSIADDGITHKLVRRYETAASSISKKLEHLFVRISSESDGIYWDS